MLKIAVSLLLEKANSLEGIPVRWSADDFSDVERKISGISLFDGAQGNLDKGRLYVADSFRGDPTLAICVPPDGCSLVFAYELLSAAFDRCRTWYEECLDLICLDVQTEEVLDFATMELHNPVAFLDEMGALVHQTGVFANSIKGTVWEGILALSYCAPDFLTEQEQERVLERADAGDDVITGALEKDPAHHFVIIPVYDGDLYCGALLSIDINEPFTAGQVEIMRLLQHLTFLAGPRKSAHRDVERGAPYYVERLLSGGVVKEGAVERHLEGRGWDAGDTYIVYRFEISELDHREGLIGIYEYDIKRLLPDAIWVRHEGGLVALGRRQDFDGSDARMRRRLDGLLSGTRIWCAVSSISTGLMDLRSQHIQCRLALGALSGQGSGHVASFDELYPGIVRQALGQTIDVRYLCHPGVLRLSESDQAQDAVRLESLKAFLLNGRSVAAASRALGVHRNTMLYRLEKLQEDIGVDFDEMDESLLTCLLVSCLLVG